MQFSCHGRWAHPYPGVSPTFWKVVMKPGHSYTSSYLLDTPPLQNVNMLLFCSQVTFYVVWRRCCRILMIWSVAAVTLAWEWSLLSAFFIVFAAIMASVFTIYCEQFTVVFPYLCFDVAFFLATKCACLQPSNRNVQGGWSLGCSTGDDDNSGKFASAGQAMRDIPQPWCHDKWISCIVSGKV